jgi:hypothetical protein
MYDDDENVLPHTEQLTTDQINAETAEAGGLEPGDEAASVTTAPLDKPSSATLPIPEAILSLRQQNPLIGHLVRDAQSGRVMPHMRPSIASIQTWEIPAKLANNDEALSWLDRRLAIYDLPDLPTEAMAHNALHTLIAEQLALNKMRSHDTASEAWAQKVIDDLAKNKKPPDAKHSKDLGTQPVMGDVPKTPGATGVTEVAPSSSTAKPTAAPARPMPAMALAGGF